MRGSTYNFAFAHFPRVPTGMWNTSLLRCEEEFLTSETSNFPGSCPEALQGYNIRSDHPCVLSTGEAIDILQKIPGARETLWRCCQLWED